MQFGIIEYTVHKATIDIVDPQLRCIIGARASERANKGNASFKATTDMCRALLSDALEAAMLHHHANLSSQVLFGRARGGASKQQLICSYCLEVGRSERRYSLFGSTCIRCNTGRPQCPNVRFDRSHNSSDSSSTKTNVDAVVGCGLSRSHHYFADTRANLYRHWRRRIRCSQCRAPRAIKRQCSLGVRRIDSLRTEFQDNFFRAKGCGARSSLANSKRGGSQWPGIDAKYTGNLFYAADQHDSQEEELAAYLSAAALRRTSRQGTTRRTTWLSCCVS